MGRSPSVTGGQWAIGELPRIFAGALNGLQHHRNNPTLRREFKVLLIRSGKEYLGILFAIHRCGVLVEHMVHPVHQGLPPSCFSTLLGVLVAHCTTVSAFLKVLVRQRRVGLYQQHKPQEAECKNALKWHNPKGTKGRKLDVVNSC